jgi:hypothetical protein
MRLLVFYGGLPDSQYHSATGRRGNKVWTNADIEDGGKSIAYKNEDPHIREEYERILEENGVAFTMPPDVFA